MYGNTLKLLRTQKDISRKEMAHQLGVSYDVFQNWENGVTDIPIDYIAPICHILKCSTDKFLNFHEKDFQWYLNSHEDAVKMLNFLKADNFNKEMALFIFNEFSGNPRGIMLMANLFTCLPPQRRLKLALMIWETFENYCFNNKDNLTNHTENLLTYKDEYLTLCKELNSRIGKNEIL